MNAVTLELPDYLYQSLERLAKRHGFSVQQLLLSAAAEKVSVLDAGALLQEEAALGRREDFDAYLKSIPDAVPVPGDEL